jgi:hypothetical protein
VSDFSLHEDEWGMISFDPDENRHDRQRVVADAAAHGEAHRAPGGIGWTEIYVAPAAAVEIAVRAITIDALREVLGSAWRSYDRVRCGYGRPPYPVIANAFAFGTAAAVVYGTNRPHVTSLCLARADRAIVDVLHRLGTTFRLVLTDLWRDEVVELANRDAVDRYLAADDDDDD